MTVNKLYKISDNVQMGRWTAERVAEDAWYVKMEGGGNTALWLSGEKFRMMFVEDEMVVDMSAEELESERLIVRESRKDRIVQFCQDHDGGEGYVEGGI